MKRVIVASTNPVKIKAAEKGFLRMFAGEDFKIEGMSAKSEVPDQPMSNEETLQGAINRVNNVEKLAPIADFWVGIEGGLQEVGMEMEAFAWVVIKSKKGKMGKGKTGSFFLPKKLTDLVKSGMELGLADDMVFGKVNSKQANGTVGNLTGDVITRITYYETAVILALIPFMNIELY